MRNRINYFLLSILLMTGFCCQTIAAPGVLWLGTKQLNAEFLIEIEKGNVPGHSTVHKFGHGDVGTTLVPITISLKYETPTAAVALEFVSADADDNATGDGAREVTIVGIDANYDELTQVIATNGLTAVPIPTPLLRVYRWWVSASGVYATTVLGSHEGALTIRVASAGATWSTIPLDPLPQSQSEIGCYTVPDGFRAYIIQQDIDVEGVKAVDIVLYSRQGIDIITAPFVPMRVNVHYVGQTGHNPNNFRIPMNNFPSRTDIIYMAEVASGTANVAIHFTIILVADGY